MKAKNYNAACFDLTKVSNFRKFVALYLQCNICNKCDSSLEDGQVRSEHVAILIVDFQSSVLVVNTISLRSRSIRVIQ
jgi:hypothetical protein